MQVSPLAAGHALYASDVLLNAKSTASPLWPPELGRVVMSTPADALTTYRSIEVFSYERTFSHQYKSLYFSNIDQQSREIKEGIKGGSSHSRMAEVRCSIFILTVSVSLRAILFSSGWLVSTARNIALCRQERESSHQSEWVALFVSLTLGEPESRLDSDRVPRVVLENDCCRCRSLSTFLRAFSGVGPAVEVVTLGGSFVVGGCTFETAFAPFISTPWTLDVLDRCAFMAPADGSLVDSQSLTWENHFTLLPRGCCFIPRVSTIWTRSSSPLREESYPDLKELKVSSR